MKRTKHSLSNYKLATFDQGELVPIGMMEALAGDSFQQSTSMLLRVTPQLGPVMHPVNVRIHHWFVPYRLVMDDWEDFITGGNDGVGEGSAIPTNESEVTIGKGELADYLGVPPGTYPSGKLNMIPFRAYNLIYNTFYRDQDLMAEENLENIEILHKIAWEKDYFTTARPWTQRGPEVTVPLGGTAEVSVGTTPALDLNVRTAAAGAGTVIPFEVSANHYIAGGHGDDASIFIHKPAQNVSTQVADLTTATAQSINALRVAFALQRYAEARAQYGARYVEYLRYYGIKSSDSRLGLPEYLAGGKQTISFSEVVGNFGTSAQNAIAVGSSLGAMGGHGIAAVRTNRYKYFCEEHGIILTLCSVRPKTLYADGLHKYWSKRTKEEFYQKELELVGQQEILTQELRYTNTGTDDDVFGYQDRYSDYRHIPSTIAGDFRDTFNSWHMARLMATTPVLNQSFINCVPTKRMFAVQGSTDSLMAMCMHSVQARRLVSNQTIGRII